MAKYDVTSIFDQGGNEFSFRDGAHKVSALPAVTDALPGVIYQLTTSGAFYVLDSTKTEWVAISVPVDNALSKTSSNPVENKVVTTALEGKQATIADLATIRSGAEKGATALQSESDPIFVASPAYGITEANKTAWSGKQDKLTNTDAEIQGAVTNSHTHTNKTELDKVKSGDVAKWDAKQDALSFLSVAEVDSIWDAN